MRANTPAEGVFALDVSGLISPEVSLWTAWDGAAIAGMGALKRLSPEAGEVKSMRTHPDHLRKGVARALLEHIISEARRRGMSRLSLETGQGPAFEPATTLYRSRGFVEGEAFAGYVPGGFSRFFHLDL
jgi:putative acetyltransferase